MMVVLSGTRRLVLSGTAESSYREPGTPGNPQKSARNWHLSNGANRKESFGFLLTHRSAVDKGAARHGPRSHRLDAAVRLGGVS